MGWTIAAIGYISILYVAILPAIISPVLHMTVILWKFQQVSKMNKNSFNPGDTVKMFIPDSNKGHLTSALRVVKVSQDTVHCTYASFPHDRVITHAVKCNLLVAVNSL